MRPRWLIVGLIVSVALNLFLIGAAAGVFALAKRMAAEPRLGALVVATQGLPQPDRRNFRNMLRQIRTELAADTSQSRDLRATAYAALAGPNPDAAAIKSQLAQSRQIDIAVRAKVEEREVDYTLGLPPSDRAIFAAGMRRFLGPPPQSPPPAPQTGSSAPKPSGG